MKFRTEKARELAMEIGRLKRESAMEQKRVHKVFVEAYAIRWSKPHKNIMEAQREADEYLANNNYRFFRDIQAEYKIKILEARKAFKIEQDGDVAATVFFFSKLKQKKFFKKF